MERITIIQRSTKSAGEIRLRFRLQDGRQTDLYHKSDIKADLKDLQKFNLDGSLKPKTSIYNIELAESIQNEISAMRSAYSIMKGKGLQLVSSIFEDLISEELHPDRAKTKSLYLIDRLREFINKGVRDNVFGKERQKAYEGLYGMLERYLVIFKKTGITPNQFTDEDLMLFRDFITNEYQYIDKHRGVYVGMQDSRLPKTQRGRNTIAGRMTQLLAFFNELVSRGEVDTNPFEKLGRQRKKATTKERYDTPVYLTADEFFKVMNTPVSKSLQETKDVFLLQCAFGCRIGDFKRLSMGKVGVDAEGVPYIHYLPQKTLKEQSDNSEIQTPIMSFALNIIKQYQFKFPVLNYVSGQCGYNAKIKELLKACEINRECQVFDDVLNDNVSKPLYELASSKLCRKTHIDIMNKAQVNQYVAGLHKVGSDAVNRYTQLTLKDRFILMCSAFEQPIYRVDKRLNVIDWNEVKKQPSNEDLQTENKKLQEQVARLLAIMEKQGIDTTTL